MPVLSRTLNSWTRPCTAYTFSVTASSRIFQGGGCYMLPAKPPATPFSTSQSRPKLHITRRLIGPRHSKPSSPAMESQAGSRDGLSSAEDRPAQWRPYQGRWNAKMANRKEADKTTSKTPEKPNPGNNSRKNRKGRKNRKLNPEAPSYGSQPEGSFPMQGNMNMMPGLDNLANLPNFHNMPLFPGFPGAPDAFNGSTFQPPFPLPNVPDQQNQFNAPLWNDMNNPTNALPILPPPPFMMNLGLQDPNMAGPMFGGFPFMPFDPMAFSAAGSAGNNFPNNPLQPVQPVQAPAGASGKLHSRRSVSPSPPTATREYMAQSRLPAKRSPSPQPLLIILDLNGALIYRKHRRFPPVFTRRDGLDNFIDTLAKNHKIMIWSSSQPETVGAVCEKLFPGDKRKGLVAEWGRDKFGLSTSQYRAKVQVYKTLKTVWANKKIQSTYPRSRGKSRWDQTNTVLIDDSKLKAISEPYNIIEIPEFTATPDAEDSLVFPKVLKLLDLLAKHDDVSKVLQDLNSRLPENKAVLDLPIEKDTPADPTPTNPSDPQSIAKARQERRKIRKQERKTRQRERKAHCKDDDKDPQTADSQETTDTPVATMTDPVVNGTTVTGTITTAPARSSSPATSVESENFLLDRLEESLNVKKD